MMVRAQWTTACLASLQDRPVEFACRRADGYGRAELRGILGNLFTEQTAMVSDLIMDAYRVRQFRITGGTEDEKGFFRSLWEAASGRHEYRPFIQIDEMVSAFVDRPSGDITGLRQRSTGARVEIAEISFDIFVIDNVESPLKN